MGKVTMLFTGASTLVLLITMGKAMSLTRGADPTSVYQWAMATFVAVLAANFVAIVHAAQSDRIIRELRRYIETSQTGEPNSNQAGEPNS